MRFILAFWYEQIASDGSILLALYTKPLNAIDVAIG